MDLGLSASSNSTNGQRGGRTLTFISFPGADSQLELKVAFKCLVSDIPELRDSLK